MTKNTRKATESEPEDVGVQVEDQKVDEIPEGEETMQSLIGWPTQDDLNPAYAYTEPEPEPEPKGDDE